MILFNLFGCDRTNNELYNKLDVDKAEEVALEYMNGKYDRTFSVVGSQKITKRVMCQHPSNPIGVMWYLRSMIRTRRIIIQSV